MEKNLEAAPETSNHEEKMAHDVFNKLVKLTMDYYEETNPLFDKLDNDINAMDEKNKNLLNERTAIYSVLADIQMLIGIIDGLLMTCHMEIFVPFEQEFGKINPKEAELNYNQVIISAFMISSFLSLLQTNLTSLTEMKDSLHERLDAIQTLIFYQKSK